MPDTFRDRLEIKQYRRDGGTFAFSEVIEVIDGSDESVRVYLHTWLITIRKGDKTHTISEWNSVEEALRAYDLVSTNRFDIVRTLPGFIKHNRLDPNEIPWFYVPSQASSA